MTELQTTDEEFEREIRHVRSSIYPAPGIVLLHIGADETLLGLEADGLHYHILRFSMGSAKTGRAFFAHEPPSPAEVEEAINNVEDEVVQAANKLKERRLLCTTDESVRRIAVISGVPESDDMSLSRDRMEQLFGRLAALSMGRPVASDDIPVDREFAATLLILREVMHHLQFDSIKILNRRLN